MLPASALVVAVGVGVEHVTDDGVRSEPISETRFGSGLPLNR
jgi:hypothetical protein